MAVKKSSERLKLVLKLAQIKQQQAADRLAEASRSLEGSKQQEKDLLHYQQEYNRHFQYFEQQLVSPMQMRNYQRFYGGLEEAVYTQGQRIEVSERNVEFHRKHWQKEYHREKNMQKLIERKQCLEDKLSENKLQKALDDRLQRRR